MATVGDVLRATLSGTMLDTVVWNLVWHYAVTAGVDNDYFAIASAIETQLQTAFVALEAQLHSDVATDNIILSEWDFVDNEWDGKAQVISDAVEGVGAFQGLPNQVGVLMRWPTAELRRQARKFVPGLHENAAFDNNIGGVVIAAAATTAAILNNTFAAGLVTLHPCTFNTTPLSPRFETLSLLSVTDFFVNTGPGTQRRRVPGAGI